MFFDLDRGWESVRSNPCVNLYRNLVFFCGGGGGHTHRLKKGDFEIEKEKLETPDFFRDRRGTTTMRLKRSEAKRSEAKRSKRSFEATFFELEVAPFTIICCNILTWVIERNIGFRWPEKRGLKKKLMVCFVEPLQAGLVPACSNPHHFLVQLGTQAGGRLCGGNEYTIL